MTAIYVGNLDADCTEAMLYQKFAPYGNLLNIHLVKDKDTGRCQGYGFVNFVQKNDAESAMNILNYSSINGRTMRLMRMSDRDIKKFPEDANVFVKNLDSRLDEKALHVVFATYGDILSLKVAKDENGASKGHAFIQFSEAKFAAEAIERLDGKMLFGKVICVTRFMTRDKRSNSAELKFQNIYLKNFDEFVRDEDLFELCKNYGDIVSAKVMTDESGASKRFGFVSFKDPQSAKEAVKELNGRVFNGQKLFADRAKAKAEREKEVKEIYGIKPYSFGGIKEGFGVR